MMENNVELAELMRSENEEQFTTLVRMHLSFELDLNTDELVLKLIFFSRRKYKNNLFQQRSRIE